MGETPTRSRLGDPSAKIPFFIVATGRCGSTYLYRLLRRHPRVALTNESGIFAVLHFFSRFAALPLGSRGRFCIHEDLELSGVVRGQYAERFSAVFDRAGLQVIDEFYRGQFAGRDFTHWGDKGPDPAAARVFQERFPATRLILVVRDPRDVVCSWLCFSRRPEVRRDFPEVVDITPESIAESWCLLYSNYRHHVPDRFEVRYEDLVRETRPTVAGLLEHLGLEPDPAVFADLDQADLFAEHATSESPEASVGRWRRDLAAEDIARIEAVCGQWLTGFGYEPA